MPVTDPLAAQPLARTLHLSPLLFHVLAAVALLIAAVAVGFGLNLTFRSAARKHPNTWAQFIYSLLQHLALPLLILAALYADLAFLTLPRGYRTFSTELIKALTVFVVYFFPAKIIALFLERLGRRKPQTERVTQFLASMTRAAFVLLAAYTLLEVLTLPGKYERFGSKAAGALGIVVVFYALARVVSLYLKRLAQQDPALVRVTEPASFVARILFALLAIVIILDTLGVHLTTVWATLGVGSVAVALALQDTLGNLFAGFYILMDRPINPGDYIKLDGSQEGYVIRVGWRATVLRTLANNLVMVPNGTMAKAVIINYSTPEERMGFGIQVSVAYGTDPQRVAKVLLEVVKSAAQEGVEGLLETPAPGVTFNPGFGASSLDFTLGFQIRRFVDQYSVQSELRKRIVARFNEEKIEMPFPTRTLIFDQSTLAALGKGEEHA